ncbi:RrF2 family transcriptional regulator [Flaviaesturariibacter aridisoli]|uniref:Rrf2 family transcriptional regulator n=1 Tax=Flaviaesturariibacter aridisoli TaxID=2545761 RepID=A0A4R4E565_9BACT|nr:Rrf2 family transcriptional regulator [Flaviaesturariibacter aridisoli]TCZ74766.1 Rrf2 family transcriptional regulator [Flaviaesturariibacter aridisoli]
MFFSKSFGYALRGILYIAACREQQAFVQTDSLAAELGVPRHFLGKVLKTLSRQGFLHSSKGQRGGFSVPPSVLERPLIELLAATDGLAIFHTCVLRLRSCDSKQPCPLHPHFSQVQEHIRAILTNNSIGSFLEPDKASLLRSLTVDEIVE